MGKHRFENVLASTVTPPHWMPHNTHIVNQFTPHLIYEDTVYLHHACIYLRVNEHLGVQRPINRVQELFYWPGWSIDVTN